MEKKAVLILSGGMDSTTLLYDILDQGYKVYALSINYNQRHSKELDCAKEICKKLGVDHKIVDLSQVGTELLQGSSLTTNSIEVPEGHYTEKSMKQTIVSNRNMILLSLAVGYAISLKATKVFYGAHSGDHAIYNDCRPEFVSAMRTAIYLCDDLKVELLAPYSDLDKGDIAIKGKELGVDYSLTTTCYKGLEKACGKCGSCVERRLAFIKSGVKDPLDYEENKPTDEEILNYQE